MAELGSSYVVRLDGQSSTVREPYGIITADCSSPKEIDDGLFVEQLDADRETYRVGVCVADTSRLYNHKDIRDQVLERTEAKYLPLMGKEQGYEPMLEPELIRDLEFSAGNARSALIVQFIVGVDLPPSDVDVFFGRVEVVNNENYHDFWLHCRDNPEYRKFARVSKFIIDHLQYTSGKDADRDLPQDEVEAERERLREAPAFGPWFEGSRINESFMVGAGHLVAKLMDKEGRPAIYRVHDPEDERNMMFLPPHIATYSWEPGPHLGLNLSPYSRVTSPLRRAEDFVLAGQLKKRFKGTPITIDDHRIVRQAVQKLNQRIASDINSGRPRTSDLDVFGLRSRQFAREVYERSQVVSLHPDMEEAAIA